MKKNAMKVYDLSRTEFTKTPTVREPTLLEQLFRKQLIWNIKEMLGKI